MLNGAVQALKEVSSESVYRHLIKSKIIEPAGLRYWRVELLLTESDIKCAFATSANISRSSIDKMFQYKILTNILATNKYLARYRILDSDICSKCNISSDTILHHLWFLCCVIKPTFYSFEVAIEGYAACY